MKEHAAAGAVKAPLVIDGVPRIVLKSGEEKRLKRGHLWIFSNEIAALPKDIAPGATVGFQSSGGEFLGTGFVNPRSLITGRILSRLPITPDAAFFQKALEEARALRESWLGGTAYRWIFGESDELPGLVIDRYDDVCVVESYCAGMDHLMPAILAALKNLGPWRAIVLKNDVAARKLEGLPSEVSVVEGEVPAPHWFSIDGLKVATDPARGQKTGFFLDQRVNRQTVARFAKGRRMLDVFCHTGGFGLWAAQAGAASVLGVDSSEEALKFARLNAQANHFENIMSFAVADAFDWLQKNQETFDVVVVDPPNIAPSKKQVPKALAALQGLVKTALARTAKDGVLAVAVCSHHIDREDFRQALARGVSGSRRTVRQIAAAGAAPDHPVRPSMPETDYLKFAMMAVT